MIYVLYVVYPLKFHILDSLEGLKRVARIVKYLILTVMKTMSSGLTPVKIVHDLLKVKDTSSVEYGIHILTNTNYITHRDAEDLLQVYFYQL